VIRGIVGSSTYLLDANVRLGVSWAGELVNEKGLIFGPILAASSGASRSVCVELSQKCHDVS
jgi:hypothetical protein